MILTGLARLGGDAVIKNLIPSGEAVCNLSLAFNFGMKDEETGKRPTQWIEGSLWGKRAEGLAPYLKKGGLINVVLADPHIETFQGKNGEGFKLVARVLDIELAGSKNDTNSASPTPSPAPAKPAPQTADLIDDDVPF
jgi:single-strand DNA-binding protein